MLLASLLIWGSAAVPGAAVSANPLAMAERGFLQCYRPDVAKKTCQSIASYHRTGPGTYDNKAIIPVSNEATLETHTPVIIEGNAVCGSIRAQDVMAGTLRVADRVVAPEAAKPILERIAQGFAPFADKEICTRYEPSGADFTARITIAGTYRPDQDETVKWIGPSDGYTVTP
jgi:hypothetical protein